MSVNPHPSCLRIVSVNDVYALENLPRLRSLVRHYADAEPASALIVVLSGDFLAPSLLSSIDAGRGMVDCLNKVGVTHVILGNHEDDIPAEELAARLSELRAVCLGTNIRGTLSGIDLPRHVVIRVADGITVGLVGVVMADTTVYRGKPFGALDLLNANDAAVSEAAILMRSGCATVVALTHQSMPEDRALARLQVDPPFPVIIGGHEHVPILEQVSDTWIVKAGAEATNAVVTTITWPSADEPSRFTVTTALEETSPYPEDPLVRERVDLHMTRVRELAMATLLYVAPSEPLSSKGARSRQTSMGTLICSKVRDALSADVCLYNGGGIRGARDYPYRFTYGDVEAELPFDNEVVVVTMKGRVVAAAVAASRAKSPMESGAFLQVDDRTVVDASHTVVTIAGKPIDPDRDYAVAVVREMLLGLDRVEPLVGWALDHPSSVPPPGSGREPKMVLVQAFAVAIWRELGGFEALDTDHDGRITPAQVAAAVQRAHPSRAPSSVLVDLVVRAVDADADRVISRADAAALDKLLKT